MIETGTRLNSTRAVATFVGSGSVTAARIALSVSAYRPGRHTDRIAAPILFLLAEDDVITPPAFARAAASRAAQAEIRTYPGRHFDVYVDSGFERAVTDQVDFLRRHLLRA